MLTDAVLFKEIDGLNRFAIKLCRNKADAEDLLQTTLLKALTHREKFDQDTKAFSWLSRIMYNSFVTGYNRKIRYESQYDPEPMLLSASCQAVQETEVMAKEVAHAMKDLTPQYREILIMVCSHEMSYEDVSKALQIPLGTVRSRLSRAREKLMDILAENDNTPYNPVGKGIGTCVLRNDPPSKTLH